MKIGLVELIPERTIVTVRATPTRSKFQGTFISETTFTLHIGENAGKPCVRVRSFHNGGIYLVPLEDVEVELRRKHFTPTKRKAKTTK